MNEYTETVTIFATKPLKGKFRHNDLLIQPSDKAKKDYYPIELQFTIIADLPYLRFSNNNRDILSKKIIEYELLLSLFSQFYFFGFEKSLSYSEKHSEKEINEIKYGTIVWYQDKSLDDCNVEEVVFPKEMALLLDRYYSLHNEEIETFRKALSLFYKSISIKIEHPSLSFLCLVSAIEAMTKIEFKEENKIITKCGQCHTIKSSLWKCDKCSAPLWGVSKMYKLFLMKYCFGNEPTEDDNIFLNKVYSTRSKIVHNGEVLKIDDFWDDDKWNWDELFFHKNLLKYTRVSLLNWLLTRN